MNNPTYMNSADTTISDKSFYKRLFVLNILYLVLYGVFRKTFGGSDGAYLIPSIFFAISFFVLLSKTILKKKTAVLHIFVAYYILISLYSVNSFLENKYLLLLSGYSYILYTVYFFVGVRLSENPKYLVRISRFVSGISVFVSLFAIFQYFGESLISGPFMTTMQNYREITGHSFGDENVLFLTSTFDVSPRMDSFLIFAFLLNVFLYAQTKNIRYILFAALNYLVVIISGHRTPGVILTVVMLATFWRKLKFRHVFWGVVSGLVLAVVYGVIGEGLESSVTANQSLGFRFFISAFGYISDRLRVSFTEVYNVVMNTPWFGFGAGYSSQGLSFIPGGEEVLEKVRSIAGFQVETAEYGAGFAYFQGFESGISKLIFEFGVVGSLLVVGLMLMIFLKAFSTKCKSSGLDHLFVELLKQYVLTIFLWFLFVHHQILGDHVTLTFLWLSMGIAYGRLRCAKGMSL